MKIIQLSETQNAIGAYVPENSHHFANGKRISRGEFDQIKREAARLDCLSTYQVNGIRHFDSVATLAS